MALGNPVRFNSTPDRPVIMITANLDLRDNQPFWRRKVFDIPRTGLLGWLFNRSKKQDTDFPWIVGGNPDPSRRKGFFKVSKGSVDEVLFSITDKLTVGTANGSEVVEVAFQHLTFISGTGGVCDTESEQGLEQRIAESLSSTLKGYFDTTIGIRVECMVNPALPSNQVNMYIGQGVFVPRRGERSIGWIRYYPDPSNRQHFSEPVLQDGRPAGLYKGQGGIVIGTVEDLLHAEIDLGSNEEIQSSYLFINKNAAQTLASEHGQSRGVDARLSFCRGHGNEPVPNMVENNSNECDLAWRIDYVGTAQIPGRMELCVDARSSRMHWKPTDTCNAAITTLLFDRNDFSDLDVDRLWIDLDHDNILIAYALQVARVSLVWDCENSEQYVYEWGQIGSPFKKPGSAGLKCRTIDKDVIEIGRADGQPFGYLELPDRPEKVIFSDAFQSFSGFHLDWLDECGRVASGDTIMSLGEAYAEKCSGMLVSKFGPGETRKVIGPLVLTPHHGGDTS